MVGALAYDAAMDEPTTPRTCFSCHENPAGEGGVLCEGCLTRITAATAAYWDDHEITSVRGVAPGGTQVDLGRAGPLPCRLRCRSADTPARISRLNVTVRDRRFIHRTASPLRHSSCSIELKASDFSAALKRSVSRCPSQVRVLVYRTTGCPVPLAAGGALGGPVFAN
jgi:hypothetical protein